MLKAHFPVGRLTFILGVLLLASGGVKATTISLGANVGTFSYTVTSDIFDCNDLYTYTRYDFNNMVYTPVDGVQHSLGSDSTYYIKGGDPGCPASHGGPTIRDNEADYSLVIVPQDGDLNVTVTVPGYVNPKFAVLGVTYAPPGPQSFVEYSNSTLISNTSSISSSFASG